MPPLNVMPKDYLLVEIVPAILIAFGLFMVAFPGPLWKLTEWENKMRGITSSKPEGWDRRMTLVGIINIFLGLGLAIYLIIQLHGATLI